MSSRKKQGENEYCPVNCKLNNGKFCGKCCLNTEMPLTKDDIKRIEKLGYPKEYFITYKNGIPRLRNINGHCIFLDIQTRKCKIYEHRPTGCRLYPLVYDAEKRGVIVDNLCPKAKEIPEKDVKKLKMKVIELLKTLEEEYNVKLL